MYAKDLIPRELPRTGQTASYRAGDDGDLQAGWPGGARFRDNGDGTATDQATGLMWPIDPANAPGAPFDAAMADWNAAIDECLALNFAGHDDWRCPNVQELFSIIDWGKGAAGFALQSPLVNPNHPGYCNVWSSTTLDALTTHAPYLIIYGPPWYSYIAYGQAKTNNTLFAWPVRGGIV